MNIDKNKLIAEITDIAEKSASSGYNHNYAEKLAEKLVKNLEEELILHGVSKSVAKEYAEFCVECDRKGLPLLLIDDYIEQYCC